MSECVFLKHGVDNTRYHFTVKLYRAH